MVKTWVAVALCEHSVCPWWFVLVTPNLEDELLLLQAREAFPVAHTTAASSLLQPTLQSVDQRTGILPAG